MLTKKQFIERINSFNFSDEQKSKCLSYYDNPSKSKSKETVINTYNGEALMITVNKWYGITLARQTKEMELKLNEIKKLITEFNDEYGYNYTLTE